MSNTILPHFLNVKAYSRRGFSPLQAKSSAVSRYQSLFSQLNWGLFPERALDRYKTVPPTPYASAAAAILIKLDQGLRSMSQLREYLAEQPGLSELLGFNALEGKRLTGGRRRLPTARHLTRLLREMPNEALQSLLDSSVEELRKASGEGAFGETVAVDTKLVIAWVKENNPKEGLSDRFEKENQPKGDADCRLGCKRRHNRSPLPTPLKEPLAGGRAEVGEFYWGYASGIAAMKVPGCGEVVLAELTQPFDQPDVSYFYPLMAQVERRLGYRPKYGALDAAFDAAYVYDYFDRAGGFAAVPLALRGGYQRTFNTEGIPYCAAGLPMQLRNTFSDHTHLVERRMERYGCPCSPVSACPLGHANAVKGKGCITTLPEGKGSRLRYTLDRNSQAYLDIYHQRTAAERIFSQAVALGIERPHLRNGRAIANLNTLIYILINLRALIRMRQK